MPNSFEVLSAELDLSHHYLLEASAGTGKTFSIENIILRLLIEGDYPLEINQILAVTFTRAAVADMKLRVRENLRRALTICKQSLMGEVPDKAHDFLRVLLLKDHESILAVKRRLEHALTAFDQAGIYTIHAFCARMLRENILEANYLVDAHAGEDDLSSKRLRNIVKDYLRTEVHRELISAQQLGILFKHFKGFEKVVERLSQAVTSIIPVSPALCYKDAFLLFVEGMQKLKTTYHIECELLFTDFLALAPYYKGTSNRKKELHPEVVAAARTFCELFEKEEWSFQDFDQLLVLKGFWNTTLEEKYSKFPVLQLNYPDFSVIYQLLVGGILERASDPYAIFSILAHGVQVLGQRILGESDQLGFNTLLRAMHEACQNEAFVKNVQTQFKAVIIDEFQDTDPLQWQIFGCLFPPQESKWGRLFLVGDPKQSIYAFRQADIYTYLAAADALGDSCKAHLDKNFRSEPALVGALNALFDHSFAPAFIQLPRLKNCLTYMPVQAGGVVADRKFNDDKGSLHLQLVTGKGGVEEVDKVVFPFVANEIARLHVEEGLKLSSFAVLVSDKFQADRLIRYLREWNIPAIYQRAPSLTLSRSVVALRELLTALVNPRDESSLKIALGGPILRWNHYEILALDDIDHLQIVLGQFFNLREEFREKGFAAFFQQLLQLVMLPSEKTVLERLLSQENAFVFYNELEQLGDWITLHHNHLLGIETLIDILLTLELDTEERSDLQIQTVCDENAVQVLTIHSSKGLEFDIIFPIGLYKRSKQPDLYIPTPDGQGEYLYKAFAKDSEEYIKYAEELDAEKMRQFYVALTRAKHRVYLPVIFSKLENRYLASPIELFAARCGRSISSYQQLYQAVSENNIDAFEANLKRLSDDVSLTFSRCDENDRICIRPLSGTSRVELLSPPHVRIPGTAKFLKSYTLLSKSSSSHGNDSGLPAPTNFINTEKSPHTLPAGNEIGIILHEILEKISFLAVSQAQSSIDLLPFVRLYIKGTAFELWEQSVADIIYATLKTPFFEGVPALCEIEDEECFKEMEFVYPTEGEYDFQGYLKGVIDLIFRYNGKYYMVDWKSNWLGPTLEHYTEAALQQAMVNNDYLLQARIYREALKRYLQLVEGGVFGGAAYVFLRGITPRSGVVRLYDTDGAIDT